MYLLKSKAEMLQSLFEYSAMSDQHYIALFIYLFILFSYLAVQCGAGPEQDKHIREEIFWQCIFYICAHTDMHYIYYFKIYA